jgi:hypothetical protein
MNFLESMETDEYADYHKHNIFYPFASEVEWELASWLSASSLSQKAIDQFLCLDYVRSLEMFAIIEHWRGPWTIQVQLNPPTFRSANELRHRVEALPAGPQWKTTKVSLQGYATKSPMRLYWHDGLEVVKHLFSNPIFAPSIETVPYRAYGMTDEGEVREYGEFMSTDQAWKIQVLDLPSIRFCKFKPWRQDALPNGHGFLGIIGATDKTPLTIGTGNKEMHPLLLSIANIAAGVRMKATSPVFALAAYLPIPKFLDVAPDVQAVLTARVYHYCIDKVVANLKIAERTGALMSDPMGRQQVLLLCHLPPPPNLTICCLILHEPASIHSRRSLLSSM